MKVWADSLEHAWCAPRIPGMFEMEQALGNEINRAVVGQISAKEALDNGNAAWKSIMEKNGFFSANAPVQYADVAPGMFMGAGKPLPFCAR
jgi:multiple sugar transport system substrate-binding protein